MSEDRTIEQVHRDCVEQVEACQAIFQLLKYYGWTGEHMAGDVNLTGQELAGIGLAGFNAADKAWDGLSWLGDRLGKGGEQ